MAALLDQQRKARETGDVGEIEKHGVFTGHYAINPFNGERLPVWVGNYILLDYGTGAIMSVPAHDDRDYDFAKKYGLEIRIVILPRKQGEASENGEHEPLLPYTAEDSLLINSGEFSSLGCRGSAAQDGGVCRGAWIWQGDGYLSAEGLGDQPAEVLGDADSDAVLREGRHCAGSGERIAGAAAGQRGNYAAGRVAAGADAGVCEREVPEMRRDGAARDGHDGYFRRFVLVFLSLHGRA